ncbi:hypothetical protein LZ32DRAFT_213959 [Colletotrichum eremochloae]|nr:hypothetical protein LZ32DRAFT_213959 [Colletotrichum eremochloae]
MGRVDVRVDVEGSLSIQSWESKKVQSSTRAEIDTAHEITQGPFSSSLVSFPSTPPFLLTWAHTHTHTHTHARARARAHTHADDTHFSPTESPYTGTDTLYTRKKYTTTEYVQYSTSLLQPALAPPSPNPPHVVFPTLLHPHLLWLPGSPCTVYSALGSLRVFCTAFRYSDHVVSCHASTALLWIAYLTLRIHSTVVLCSFAGLPCLSCPGSQRPFAGAFPFPFLLTAQESRVVTPLLPWSPDTSTHMISSLLGGTRWITRVRERHPLLVHPCPAATPAPTCRATYTHVGLHTHTHIHTYTGHTHTQTHSALCDDGPTRQMNTSSASHPPPPPDTTSSRSFLSLFSVPFPSRQA